MLVAGLSTITPTADYLTEEGTTVGNKSDYYWIIDPLDGTTNYLFNLSKFSISIALYANGKPIYANVYVPVDKEMFIATPEGAFLNNTPISVSTREDFSKTLIATGFPYYNFTVMQEYLLVLQDLMKSTKGLRRIGSAAIDLAYTACGRFDAFFELNLSPWDVAAGAYIVKQAGGKVSDFKGDNDYVFGNTILATSELSYTEMRKTLTKAGL
jgi:myo-inositol-1(or 4)-monophosphatase